jgi:hypothetical protein
MELESHLSFYVLIFVTHLTFLFVCIIEYLIVELGGHQSVCHKPFAHAISIALTHFENYWKHIM